MAKHCRLECPDGKHTDNLPVSERSFTYLKLLIDKLGKYEDLEEQGRLLRLPCDIGTKVYKPYIAVCEGKPWLYAPNIDVHYIKLEDLPEMGKTVFLKRSEAERELKKMTIAHKAKLKEMETT